VWAFASRETSTNPPRLCSRGRARPSPAERSGSSGCTGFSDLIPRCCDLRCEQRPKERLRERGTAYADIYDARIDTVLFLIDDASEISTDA